MGKNSHFINWKPSLGVVLSNQVYESAAIQDPGINNGTRNKAGTQSEYNTE